MLSAEPLRETDGEEGYSSEDLRGLLHHSSPSQDTTSASRDQIYLILILNLILILSTFLLLGE